MPSSTSNSEFQREIPDLPWKPMAIAAALMVAAMGTGWEVYCRAHGYAATLDDDSDFWAAQREKVKPESLVIIGDSRPWFDLDLDELERGLGQRPVQLAIAGSCAYPVLADFADDLTFHGTVICSVVPGMFFAPGGFLIENSERALKRYHRWTPAQRMSHYLSIPLEETFAFLNQDDLTLSVLLKKLPIPNRPGALVPPPFPPYFNSMDKERRARMVAQAERPGALQSRIREGWLPLFTPPPPPTYVPKEAFAQKMQEAMAARMKDAVSAVAKIRARGGKVVFVRFPFGGELKKLEDRLTPRSQIWDPLVKLSGASGIYFEDYPELASFTCPEWSHLSSADSVAFTKRLVPYLQRATGPAQNLAAVSRPAGLTSTP